MIPKLNMPIVVEELMYEVLCSDSEGHYMDLEWVHTGVDKMTVFAEMDELGNIKRWKGTTVLRFESDTKNVNGLSIVLSYPLTDEENRALKHGVMRGLGVPK